MTTQMTQNNWATFQSINRHRRAIRKFNATPIHEEDIRELLAEAMLAPSSGNLQPYQLHWIRNANLKAEIAKACHVHILEHREHPLWSIVNTDSGAS